MTRRPLLLLLPLLLLPPVPSAAAEEGPLTLDEARRRGWVGERPDGYVAPVDPAAPEAVRALVARVNAERRRVYEELARREGVPVAVVAAITARKIVEKLPPGAYFMDEKGRWHRKGEKSP